MKPTALTWTDSFARLFHADTLSYVLPVNVPHDKAPSRLIIDGYGTLELKRTRVSLHNHQALQIIDPDDAKRPPLVAGLQPARDAAATQVLGPTAKAPQVGMGRGRMEDKGLFTTRQMVAYGAVMYGISVGLGALATAPLTGVTILAGVILGLGYILSSASYHVRADPEETPEVVLATVGG